MAEPADHYQPVPAPEYQVPVELARSRAQEFADVMASRRTIRDFSPTPIPPGVIQAAIQAASSAPSGANIQPWRFVVVTDPERKRIMREGAEAEEREFYERSGARDWHAALAPLGTDSNKPFLEIAPAIIAVFEVHKGPNSPRPYYAKESVGIAVGLLLAALHHAGLATLTHTPSPMRFLNQILDRPVEERPFVLIPVGYAAHAATVPAITRKPLREVLIWS